MQVSSSPETYLGIVLFFVVGTILIVLNGFIASVMRAALGSRLFRISGWGYEVRGFFVFPVLVGGGLIAIGIAYLVLILFWG